MQEAIMKQLHYHPKQKYYRPKVKPESNIKVVIPNIIIQYKPYKKKTKTIEIIEYGIQNRQLKHTI